MLIVVRLVRSPLILLSMDESVIAHHVHHYVENFFEAVCGICIWTATEGRGALA